MKIKIKWNIRTWTFYDFLSDMRANASDHTDAVSCVLMPKTNGSSDDGHSVTRRMSGSLQPPQRHVSAPP